MFEFFLIGFSVGFLLTVLLTGLAVHNFAKTNSHQFRGITENPSPTDPSTAPLTTRPKRIGLPSGAK